MNFEIVGTNHSISDGERAGGCSRAAVSQTGGDTIEDGRENSEDGEFPDQTVAQVQRLPGTLDDFWVDRDFSFRDAAATG